MKLLVLYTFLLFGAIAPHQDDAGSPSLRFEIKNAGITVKGDFENWEHTVYFDPKNLAACKLSGKAEVASIHTGINSRDKHLQTRQYFKSDTWPYIIMKSQRILHKGGNRYEGVFDLTMRDVTKQVNVPFTAEKKGDGWKLSGSLTINRLDFGVGESSMILGNDVKVFLTVGGD